MQTLLVEPGTIIEGMDENHAVQQGRAPIADRASSSTWFVPFQTCLLAAEDNGRVMVMHIAGEISLRCGILGKKSICTAFATEAYCAHGFHAGHPAILRCDCRRLSTGADQPLRLPCLWPGDAGFRCRCARSHAQIEATAPPDGSPDSGKNRRRFPVDILVRSDADIARRLEDRESFILDVTEKGRVMYEAGHP